MKKTEPLRGGVQKKQDYDSFRKNKIVSVFSILDITNFCETRKVNSNAI